MTNAPARAEGAGVVRGAGARWLLPLLFALSLPLVTVRIYAADEIQYFAPLRSLWKDGDLDYRNEYERLLEGRGPQAPERRMLLDRTTATGRAPDYAEIGCALLWAPFFAAGDLAARLGGWPADGYSYPYRAAVCFASAFYGFLGLCLLGALARESHPAGFATAAVALAWWATALPFYLYVTPPMPHATSLFTVSLFLWLWSRWGLAGGPARSFLLGVGGGLMVLVREQNALFLFLLVFDLGRALWQAPRRRDHRQGGSMLFAAAAVGSGVAITFAPQLLVWKALFGRFGPATERLSFFLPWPRHLLDVLVSADHGLISWHPVWIFGTVGMVLYARHRPKVGLPLLVVFALNLLFLGSVTNWAAGMAFGQRRLLDCLFIVVLGCAAVMERLPRSVRALVAGLLVWWNLSLLVQFGSGMIPREGPVDWRVVVRNQLVTVPARLPEMARRYLADRPSFFDARRSKGSG
jgi:hypothetical protein